MGLQKRCQRCGEPIRMMMTYKGKPLPVDMHPVRFIIGGTERRRFITENGDIYRGEIAGSGEKSYDKMAGYACHWDTCKGK